jgi:hypothetical protein
VFAIWDGAWGKSMSWHPTRTPGSSLRRFRIGVTWWSGSVAVLWLALALWRTVDPRFPAVRGPVVLRLAQSRGREPRHLSRGQRSMRSRLVMILAVVLAAAAVAVRAAGWSIVPAAPGGARLPAARIGLLPGRLRAGAPPGYGPVAEFAQAAGRQPNLVGYYSGWAEPFDTSFAEMIHKHGVIPFVQIDPTDASVAAIAAGTYDGYLRSYADSVRDFGHAVVIGFGHEMNAPGTRGATGMSRRRRSWRRGGTS